MLAHTRQGFPRKVSARLEHFPGLPRHLINQHFCNRAGPPASPTHRCAGPAAASMGLCAGRMPYGTCVPPCPAVPHLVSGLVQFSPVNFINIITVSHTSTLLPLSSGCVIFLSVDGCITSLPAQLPIRTRRDQIPAPVQQRPVCITSLKFHYSLLQYI